MNVERLVNLYMTNHSRINLRRNTAKFKSKSRNAGAHLIICTYTNMAVNNCILIYFIYYNESLIYFIYIRKYVRVPD